MPMAANLQTFHLFHPEALCPIGVVEKGARAPAQPFARKRVAFVSKHETSMNVDVSEKWWWNVNFLMIPLNVAFKNFFALLQAGDGVSWFFGYPKGTSSPLCSHFSPTVRSSSPFVGRLLVPLFFALHLISNAEIFSLEFHLHYNHLFKSTAVKTAFWLQLL